MTGADAAPRIDAPALAAYAAPWPVLQATVVLCLACGMLTMDVALMGLMAEPLRAGLGLSDAQLAILQGAAPKLAYAFSALPVGLLVDRYNRVLMVIVAVCLWSAAIFGMSTAQSFAVLVGCKIVIGVAMAVLLIAPFSILADMVRPERRARSASVLVIGQYIGASLGYMAGGWVFDALARNAVWLVTHVGDIEPWRATFMLFGSLGILLLLLLFSLREPVRRERSEGAGAVGKALKDLFAYRRILVPLYAGYFCAVVSHAVMQVWMPPALVRIFGLTPGQFGVWVGIMLLIGGVAGSAAGGWLADITGRRGVPMIAAAVAAALFGVATCFALAPSAPWALAFYGISTVTWATIATGAVAIKVTYVPNELRGLVSGGLILLAIGPGQSLGPSLVPMVKDAIGGQLGLAIALVGVPSALLAAAGFALLRGRPRAVSAAD